MSIRTAALPLAGAAAVASAALLAAWGLGFGLPYLFRPDEDVLVGRSVRMAAEGSLDPLFANWPPLVFYVVALAEKLTGNLGGAMTADPSGAYLTGRVLSAAAFTVTVGLVLLAAREAYGSAAAVLAAFVTALSPLAVRQAHMATIDGFETLLVAAAILAALRAQDNRGHLLAGALCGLAAAAKYTGGMVLVFAVVMALQRGGRRPALWAMGGTALAFVLACPIMIVHPSAYAGGFAFLGGRGFARDYGTPLGWLYHPTVSLPFGLGLGAYALALAGLVWALVRREPADRALLAYAGAYMLVIGASHEVFWRYVLPLVPALAMAAGGLVRALPRAWLAPGLALGFALLLPSAWASVSTDRLLAATDTRRLAADWLIENAPPDASIQADYYISPFYDQAMVDANRRWVDDELAAGFMQGRYTARYRINRGEPDYVLAGSRVPGQAAPAALADRPVLAVFSPGQNGDLYDAIDTFFVPIWGFSGVERPGPSIVIYGPRR
jgi:4-amino-4-deoxy-L-arabinose transferase-like glycosyltransferase